MSNRNPYTCIAFFPGTAPKKWRHVPRLDTFLQFLKHSHPSWEYMNVYDKDTGKFLTRLYPSSPLPANLP